MSSSRKSTARRSADSDRPPLRLVHTSAPRGCESETTSTLHALSAVVGGAVTVRVRRIVYRAYVGGRGYVWSRRVEVAVKTPRTVAERMGHPQGRGFVVVDDHYLDDWRTPADDLAVHVAVGAAIEAEMDRRRSNGRADDDDWRIIQWPAAAHKPRTLPPAANRREALRRLLHVRTQQLERTTGVDRDDTRHEAARFASHGRTESSTRLSESEMEAAVSYVEDALRRAEFDFDAADDAYRQRQAGTTRAAA